MIRVIRVIRAGGEGVEMSLVVVMVVRVVRDLSELSPDGLGLGLLVQPTLWIHHKYHIFIYTYIEPMV